MRRNLDSPPERTIAQLEYDLGLSPQRNFFGWLVDLLSPNLANTFPLHKTSIPDDVDSFESCTTAHICNAFGFHPGRMTSICHDADRFESQTTAHICKSVVLD